MQIKAYDAALNPGSTRPAALRASDASQLSPRPPLAEGDSVSFSDGARSLAVALRAALPTLEVAQIAELLTPRDRFVLVRALDLSRAENLPAEEVHALIVDLSRYRVQEQRERAANLLLRGPDEQSGRGGPDPALQGAQQPLLALPVFSPEDEALARSLLTALALRDTVVDHGFVRALVDPDRAPTHAVDFSFLRRLVLSLSPAHADGAPDPDMTLARRDTRAALATALTELALAHDQLPAPALQVLARGRALLKAHLVELTARLAPTEEPPLLVLRRNDRTLLGMLYLVSELQQRDPGAVDEVAQALVALRRAERADLASVQRALTIAPPSAQGESGEAPGAPAPAPLQSMRPTQLASGARASMLPSVAPPATRASESSEEPSPFPARSFGSSSQLAAKASGSYRSLVPPPPAWAGQSPLPRDLGAAPALALLAHEPLQPTHSRTPLPPALTRPLDLGQALGLGAWFAQARGQARRAVRARLTMRPEAAIHAVTAARETAGEAEADDPILDDSHKRRRVRWQLLIQRRRRTRKRKPL